MDPIALRLQDDFAGAAARGCFTPSGFAMTLVALSFAMTE